MLHIVISSQELASFFVKVQIINILGSLGHTVSVKTTQHCHYRVKAVIENMQINGLAGVPIQLYLQNQRWVRFSLLSLSAPAPHKYLYDAVRLAGASSFHQCGDQAYQWLTNLSAVTQGADRGEGRVRTQV